MSVFILHFKMLKAKNSMNVSQALMQPLTNVAFETPVTSMSTLPSIPSARQIRTTLSNACNKTCREAVGLIRNILIFFHVKCFKKMCGYMHQSRRTSHHNITLHFQFPEWKKSGKIMTLSSLATAKGIFYLVCNIKCIVVWSKTNVCLLLTIRSENRNLICRSLNATKWFTVPYKHLYCI